MSTAEAQALAYAVPAAWRTRANERGAVLILVLILMAGLAVLAIEFSRYGLLDHALSSSLRSVLSAKLLGESAEQLAAEMLVQNYRQGTPDHPEEDWGKFDLVLQHLSTELLTADLHGRIEDENSRFPLNAIFHTRSMEKGRADMYAAILERLIAYFLQLHGYAGGDLNTKNTAKEIVHSILQWGGGAELDQDSLAWYLKQVPRRIPPQRLLQSADELFLLRWPHIEEDLQKKVLLGSGTVPGLLENITIWAQGPMNINTLRPHVLVALTSDMQQADSFAQNILYLREKKDTLYTQDWYKQIFSNYGIVFPVGVIDTTSRWYRLHVDISVGARKTQLTSIGWVKYDMMTWEFRTMR